MRAHLDIKHEGTLDGESRQRMTFDENSVAHLMSILTDMYSNPALAVIREYPTNALDSHRAAGITDPIEIELPTAMYPMFVVRDHGVGMSVNDITDHFSKYGWSSKRDSDNEVGMLGLGCKSGLTYTSQFTLVAVREGVQTTVLVTRESDGAGAVQIIDTVSTDLPNGVEVTIPVSDVRTFNHIAEKFFRFWRDGEVLIDGKAPQPIGQGEGDLWLDPDILITDTVDSDYVVMGNVAYPVLTQDKTFKRLSEQTSYNHYAVVWVPIGTVDFTPSRESLHATKRTKEVLDTARRYIADAVVRKAQGEIDACATAGEAWLLAHHWGRAFQGLLSPYLHYKLTYRWQKIPHQVYPEDPKATLRWLGRHATTTASRFGGNIGVEDASKGLFIHGHNGRSLTQWDKQRINKYRESKGLLNAGRVVYASRAPIAPEWLDFVERADWPDIKQIKLPTENQPVRNVKPPKTFKVLNRHGACIYVEKLNPTILYLPADRTLNRQGLMNQLYPAIGDSVSVMPVPAAQIPKFIKEHPKALLLREYLEDLHALWLAGMTEASAYRFSKSSKLLEFLSGCGTLIDDPKLSVLVGEWEQSTTAGWITACLSEVGSNKRSSTFPPESLVTSFTRRIKAATAQYPLLEFIPSNYYDPKEKKKAAGKFISYLNAKYLSDASNPTQPKGAITQP